MIVIFFVTPFRLLSQTGIGTTSPHASAKLEVASDRQGFLPPRMTSSQRTSIQNPATGLMVYQTDGTAGLYYHNGTTWIYIINSTTDVLPVANGGTGLSALGNGVATFIGTPTSANLASAITNETGSGALVFGTSPTISLPTITSGSDQFPQSIFISPSTHATSKRAAIWLDGWSILQDVLGNGTKNFSIGETISGPQYPTRFVIAQGNGNVGIGTSSPTEKLEVSGNVKATNFIGGEIPIYLSANKASSQSIPHNVETTVTNWDGAGWFNNFPSAWNSTTGAWTCPRAGVYEFFFSAMLAPHAASVIGNEFAVVLSLNGVSQSSGSFWAQTTSTTRTPHVITNLIMSLNVGDVVTTRIYQNLNLNTAINTQSGRLYFQIKQLPSRINIQ